MGRTFYKSAPDTLAFGIVPAYRTYELYYARFHEMRAVLAPLLKASTADRPLRILDVGSGTGDAKRFIDPLGGHARWTAVEGQPARAQQCRDLGYSEVLEKIDLEKEPLPFADGSFDAVIASHVLEHLANAGDALKDWHRVLSPGGSLILGVPMHLVPVACIARARYRLFGRKRWAHCHFFSLPSLRSFLRGYDVRAIWGFRLLSARRQLPLEDWERFYKLSLWLGRRFPNLCAEVNVHIVKP